MSVKTVQLLNNHKHLRKVTLTITRYYPNHEDREETAEYRHTRHQLIVVEKRPCWVCGTREHLECHHFYVEWADQNAIDWKRFMAEHPNVVDWSKFKDPKQFVDAPENMRILCATHHRHKNHGIHCVDYPTFQFEKYKFNGFVYAPKEAA